MRGRLFCLVALVACGLPARSGADPAPPELVVIVNADNTAAPTAAELERYFLKKDRHWGDGSVVVPIDAVHDTTARKQFDQAVLGMSVDESARYWLDLRIRSGDSAPKELADAALTVRLVGKLKGTLAYVPAGTKLTGVRVVARIKGTKLVVP